MAAYIEREAALRVLCDACGNSACPKGLIPRCSYYEKMQSIPAADVRPVVKGGWEEHGEPNQYGKYEPWYYQCTRCGAVGLQSLTSAPTAART